MPANSVQLERDLDHQVDRLVAGKSAVSYGDADLRALVATAKLLSSLAATIPAATGLFSTNTRCPSASPSLSATKRAGISVGPPAPKPMTSRIGRVG